jgi:hypothetical protein
MILSRTPRSYVLLVLVFSVYWCDSVSARNHLSDFAGLWSTPHDPRETTTFIWVISVRGSTLSLEEHQLSRGKDTNPEMRRSTYTPGSASESQDSSIVTTIRKLHWDRPTGTLTLIDILPPGADSAHPEISITTTTVCNLGRKVAGTRGLKVVRKVQPTVPRPAVVFEELQMTLYAEHMVH